MVVVGAGPAGSVAALVLARAGVRVLLVDRARFPRPKLCGDSINPGTLALLGRLGLDDLAVERGITVAGMVVTGTSGARVEARYPAGIRGRIVSRCEFDASLLERVARAGAVVESGARVTGVVGGDRVTGVAIATPGGTRTASAALTIAADGRHSTVAFGRGLARHPPAPRRWAVGAYCADVDGLSSFGEMHIRRGHYIGVAPLPGGLANLCVVTSNPRALAAQGDLHKWLLGQVSRDPLLAPRFERARPASDAMSLGPLAVDATAAGVPGLLLAGDAAGFIDPMTGDGMRFAIRGGELAAQAALAALCGHTDHPHVFLDALRRREFARKQRFNRLLRRLVAYPAAVGGASLAARLVPSLVRRLVCYAGDVNIACNSLL